MASYTVKSGDTLSKIALRFYGSAGKYPLIASANGIAAPYIIRVGQVLTIPNLAGSGSPVPAPPPLLARPDYSTTPAPSSGSLPLPFDTSGNVVVSLHSTPTPQTRTPSIPSRRTPTIAAPGGGFMATIMQHKKLLIGGAAGLALLAAVSSGGKK